MSIIEKALDKLEQVEDKGSQPLLPDAPLRTSENRVQFEAVADAGLAPEARRHGPERQQLQTPKPTVDAALERPMLNPEPAVAVVEDEHKSPLRRAEQEEIKTIREVQLDLERLGAVGIITPTSAQTLVAEQYRIIKRPLLMKMAAADGQHVANVNLIMVTSALPGEGKTFTAINLAMSVAMELDRTVLLVDTDILRSDVTNVLGIDVEAGLTDYLLGEDLPLSDVLIKTNVSKLTILPAGRHHPNVTELLASEDMKRLTEELTQRYRDRVVIFDSPPMLSASGAKVMASLVGQVVFVVEATRTTQSSVKEALKILEPLDNIGLVLNKSRQRLRSEFGYMYGAYGGD